MKSGVFHFVLSLLCGDHDVRSLQPEPHSLPPPQDAYRFVI